MGSLYFFCVCLKTSTIKWESNTDNNKAILEQNKKSYVLIKCLLGNVGVAKLLLTIVYEKCKRETLPPPEDFFFAFLSQ